MPNVVCRPQLHKATTEEQYAEFHAKMSGFGLERKITRNGKVYRLPNGEYLGVNLSPPFDLLALKIDAAARQITGYGCELTLAPVRDVADIYIYGLKEDLSFESQLSMFGSLLAAGYSEPSYSALSGLAAAVPAGKNTVPSSFQPSYAEPNYSALSALAAAMSKR